MSAFHRPKVYRSPAGCCICKAKSSTSRFTDSSKYENDLISCFQLMTPRHGEICNACVLLVKRFQRLPAGTSQHWGHVVDARAGPGIKCMSKAKKRCEQMLKICKTNEECDDGGSFDDDDSSSDVEMSLNTCTKRKTKYPRRNFKNPIHKTHFVNVEMWKKTAFCCGNLYCNDCGQTAVEISSLRLCPKRFVSSGSVIRKCQVSSAPGKVFSDNSCDSGYDELGNSSPQDSAAMSQTNEA